MKIASLSGSSRKNVGKKGASELRTANQVPGVLYGGKTQTHFAVDEVKLSKLVINPDVFAVELDIDGTTIKCIIQEVQFHPVTDRIVHIDLLEILDGKEIKVNLPLISEGTAKGVINGGRMETLFRRVPVQGLFENLPNALTADVSPLKIGDNLRVSDLSIEGCRILLNDSVLLFACRLTRAAMSEEEEEAEAAEAAAAEAAEAGEGEGEGEEGSSKEGEKSEGGKA
ncbi:MAG: 50S ribosomal protein L25 [Flavobacteriales bacterium]|jgi:large subunit ribosomal protein L25